MPEDQAETWRRWKEVLPRFAAANERAEEEFLASLSQEEGLRIFEDLCAEIQGPDDDRDDDSRPVPLVRLWRRTA